MGRTIADAQRVLVDAGNQIEVDGVWGRRTNAAFMNASAQVQDRVEQLFRQRGLNPPWQSNLVHRDVARQYVAEACAAIGIPEHTEALKKFLDLEARRQGEYYDGNSVNGASKGLFQMQRAAWQDAQRVYPQLPGYEKVLDPRANVYAGVAYAKRSIDYFKRKGIPATDRNLYLAHNQGLGYFNGARTAVDKQSQQVQRWIAQGPDLAK